MLNKSDNFFDNFRLKYPNTKIVLKNTSKLMNVISWILMKIFRVDGFKDDFCTTIGNNIYVPNDFNDLSDNQKYELLRHECKHVEQFHSWPFKALDRKYLWRINSVIMGFCYLFLLPVKWTFRAYFEKQAYAESIKVYQELGWLPTEQSKVQLATFIADSLSGPSYFYAASHKSIYAWAMKLMT